jgi:hypothetical protein
VHSTQMGDDGWADWRRLIPPLGTGQALRDSCLPGVPGKGRFWAIAKQPNPLAPGTRQ